MSYASLRRSTPRDDGLIGVSPRGRAGDVWGPSVSGEQGRVSNRIFWGEAL